MPDLRQHIVFTREEVVEICEGNDAAWDDLHSMSYYRENLVTIAGYRDLEEALRATLPESQKGLTVLMKP